MEAQDKEFIDNSTYEVLLHKWRTAEMGHPIFQGNTGKYFQTVMFAKKKLLSVEAQVQVSKSVGF